MPIPLRDEFRSRHLGPRDHDVQEMIEAIGVKSLDQLIDQTNPAFIRLKRTLNLPEPMSEKELTAHLRGIVARNVPFRSFLGNGYYGCQTPQVIQRAIFENPGWYTQYTPYQAEIPQGRLESARLFEEARSRADREQAIAQVTSAISSAGDFDTIFRTTVEEIGKTLGDSEVSIQLTDNLE